MTRDVPFDEEVAESDAEEAECFADQQPLEEMQERQRRWAAMFYDVQARSERLWLKAIHGGVRR